MEDTKAVKWKEGVNLINLDRETIFDSIQHIDNSVFHENGLASKESDIARYEAYKDSYIFALHGEKIVGYLCYFPVTKRFYEKMIKGLKVYDGDILPADICGLNESSNFLFLLSVAILPEYQKKGISIQFSGILKEELAKIKTDDIVSYAFTAEGERFLSVFGLKKYKDMEDGIKLMRRTV